MTEPTVSNKITMEELFEMFGASIPIEIANKLFYNEESDKDVEEMRQEFKALAQQRRENGEFWIFPLTDELQKRIARMDRTYAARVGGWKELLEFHGFIKYQATLETATEDDKKYSELYAVALSNMVLLQMQSDKLFTLADFTKGEHPLKLEYITEACRRAVDRIPN